LSARGETITIRDLDGNVAATTTYSGAPGAAQRFLRITEVNYHPAAPSAGESLAGFTDPNDFEFLEIKNIGSVDVDLGGVRFDDGIAFVVPVGTVLAAGQLAVVVSNENAFAARYGPTVRVLGQYTGRLSNEGEGIQLQDAVGENILKFTYNNRWYPATDGAGYAMVILDEEAEWSRWGSASGWGIGEPRHGSPGLPNSRVIRQQFEGWLNHHFSEVEIRDRLVSGPSADPNADGYSNFHHYAFGSNPRAAATSEGQLVVAITNGFFEITHAQCAGALDLEFVTESSDDLSVWTPVDAPIVDTSAVSVDSTVVVTRRDSQPVTATGESRRFWRVRALQKP
jgi:hypothetical protein